MLRLFSCCILFISIHIIAAVQNPRLAQTWSNRQGLTLTPITSGVWAAERPFLWNNIDVGGRSVVARTNDGNLLVHSPVEWTEDLGSCLASLGGKVSHVIIPNYEHLKYSFQWRARYPSATFYACPGLATFDAAFAGWTTEIGIAQAPVQAQAGREAPKLTATETDAKTETAVAATVNEAAIVADSSVEVLHFDCERNPFTNKPFFSEVAFLHKRSGTFFCSDAFWNYPATDRPNFCGEGDCDDGDGGEDPIHSDAQHICPKMPTPVLTGGTLPRVSVPLGTRVWKFGMDKVYLPFYRRFMVGRSGDRRQRYDALVQRILGWDVQVIVPCHGDVIRGRAACRKALQQHFV